MTKILIVSLSLLLIASSQLGAKGSKASKPAVTKVKSYKKKNGIVVSPHDRTVPNKTKTDNWSTRGNTNPETGKNGTKDPKK